MGRLALPHKPAPHDGVSPELIDRECREAYDQVPAAASIVVGAVDVQDGRLEAELSAWGAVEVEQRVAETDGYHGLRHAGRWYTLRRWALAYRRIHGDPGTAEPWNELRAMMEETHVHESGIRLRPCIVVVDTGGHYTEEAATFCRTNGPAYQALKGLGERRHGGVLAKRSVTADSLHDYGSAGLLLINTNVAKESVFSMLRQSCQGAEPRPMTWPLSEELYGVVEFESICSEARERYIDKRTGHTRRRWVKIAKANEALDVLTYSLAAVSHLGVGFLLSEADLIERATNERTAIAA